MRIRRSLYERTKRLIDRVVAGILLALLMPLLAVIAAGVRLRLGSPILFRQVRAGREGVPFVLVKFRTMRPPADLTYVDPDTDSARLDRFGQLLRSTSLDELPTLVNVLRGDMSLVGPRPLLPEYTPLYSPYHARRLEVPPGLTGWAQVNGRNSLSWSERFDLDVWYVEHRSHLLDFRILAATLRSVVTHEGIKAEGHASMPRFTGYRDDGLTDRSERRDD